MNIQGQSIEELAGGSIWKVTIFKPLYGTTVALSDAIIAKAIKSGVMLIVSTHQGKGLGFIEEYINPRKWKAEATKIERYYKYNEPMVMWQREVHDNTEALETRPRAYQA